MYTFGAFPRFTITDIDCDASSNTVLRGSVSTEKYQGHDWIGDRWLGFIAPTDSTLLYGQWMKDDDNWSFNLFERLDDQFIEKGNSYPFIDGYWGERIELLFDDVILTRDTFRNNEPAAHDHCFFCWATISKHENPLHWRTDNNHAVCDACYETYVKDKSLDFIQFPANG